MCGFDTVIYHNIIAIVVLANSSFLSHKSMSFFTAHFYYLFFKELFIICFR